MDKYEILKNIFENNKNEVNAIKMSKYMKDHFAFYGIPSPLKIVLLKTLLKN